MAGYIAGAIAVSSLIGANTSRRASQTQADSATRATDAQREMFERQVELQAPFREAGLAGQNRLMEYLGIGGQPGAAGYGRYATADFTPAQFAANQDPGYAFRMSEGMRALNQAAAMRGGLISGNALKAATRYGQDAASAEYQNAFNRYQTQRTNTLNPYAALGGVAQSASNTMGNAASAFGNQMGSNIIGAGNAAAAGQVGAANAISSGVGQGINYYQNQDFINRLRPASSGGYTMPEPYISAGGADAYSM